jgi:hypothetical protein
MKPDVMKCVGGVVGVVDNFKCVKGIVKGVERNVNPVICLLLKISFLRKGDEKEKIKEAAQENFFQRNYFIKYKNKNIEDDSPRYII